MKSALLNLFLGVGLGFRDLGSESRVSQSLLLTCILHKPEKEHAVAVTRLISTFVGVVWSNQVISTMSTDATHIPLLVDTSLLAVASVVVRFGDYIQPLGTWILNPKPYTQDLVYIPWVLGT